ncbi:MAG: hypothetical protein NT020_08890, partial [Chloroflexales bacterium]|nr:hypothetical protein [Chloroflexales bacterium]
FFLPGQIPITTCVKWSLDHHTMFAWADFVGKLLPLLNHQRKYLSLQWCFGDGKKRGTGIFIFFPIEP